MFIKLDYFSFSAFDLEMKVTDILKVHCNFLWRETWAKEKLPSFRKILVAKMVLLHAIEK